jgi:hypothetical protein
LPRERARATQFGIRIFCTAALLAASTGVALAEEATFQSPRPTMRAVFDEMKVLIPLSFSEDRWRARENQEKVLAALARLENAAVVLEQHGRDREEGFDELALNLGRDFYRSLEHYRRGEYEESRFFLAGSLQTCMACHVRLPSDQSFPFATELTDRAELAELDPEERAWLLVTVRRFDEALSIWEGMLADPKIAPAQLDGGGALGDYLNVAIRVRGDLARARTALDKFAQRGDLPIYLARRVRDWRSALGELDPKNFGASGKPSFELGEKLAEGTGGSALGPYGRDRFIQDLAAASQLVQWLEQDRLSRKGVTRNLTEKERGRRARAYYWLGVVEARSLDGFWNNLSERHLEAAIRVDPKGPMAEPAYSLLEETQVLGFGGSSGVHLPPDVWTLLKELRELMGRAG